MKITQEQIEKGQELMQALVTKAWENAEFKDQLMTDPTTAIENLTGKPIELPEGKRIVVQDQSNEDIIYINIPAKPNLDEMELSDEQLEMVSGGEFVTAGLALACVGLFASGVGIGLAVSAMKK